MSSQNQNRMPDKNYARQFLRVAAQHQGWVPKKDGDKIPRRYVETVLAAANKNRGEYERLVRWGVPPDECARRMLAICWDESP